MGQAGGRQCLVAPAQAAAACWEAAAVALPNGAAHDNVHVAVLQQLPPLYRASNITLLPDPRLPGGHRCMPACRCLQALLVAHWEALAVLLAGAEPDGQLGRFAFVAAKESFERARLAGELSELCPALLRAHGHSLRLLPRVRSSLTAGAAACGWPAAFSDVQAGCSHAAQRAAWQARSQEAPSLCLSVVCHPNWSAGGR